ncbi:sensor histidine kinase [Streptomyces sp. NBC_01264]|uniref:sensor histidine kinase n=1 Tax=Streptomyces sp. NBC_01264 TaxID=2903804 RepID=UPI0022596BF1|nr:nitrate- and nitrite sensing domain-containing protein [Streptomyces sp. NBC_01264]MCX4781754.1 nitrate- and nitrite sensing domain-containing protein [Streptomyces sp. NBC_01264]
MRVQRQGRNRLRKASPPPRRPGRQEQDTSGSPESGASRRQPRRGPRLGDLRVRTRLLAVIAIPLIVATGLGALRVSGSLDEASRYEQFHEVAQLARTGTALVQQLQHERDVTIDPAARSAAGANGLANVRQQTDTLQQRLEGESAQLSQDGQIKTRLAAVKEAFAAFPRIREAADGGATGSATDTGYLSLIMPLLGIDNALDGQLAQSHSQGWGLYTLSLSTSMLSSERALMSQAEAQGSLTSAQRASLLATVKIRDMAQREFTMAAPPGDRTAFARSEQSPASRTAEQALQQMLQAPQDLSKGSAPAQNWYADFGTRVQQLDKLALQVSDQLVSRSSAQYDDAMGQARLDAGVTAGLLVAALGLAFAVSRSISQGLAELHAAATDVAEVRLPQLMRELKDNAPASVDLTVPPSGITTRDDIGDVAQAFDAVHREAVRLAGDQARLRESVSTLFRNLSHRNQSLVQRQLSILTTLEQNEDDGVQLKRLFELDHLAARMRRNSENLLVLAGGQSTSRTSRPMSLLDVLRTAMSEVEQFERVGHLALPPVFVAGYAVGDIAHLLSELLENALMFSSPQTEVRVGAQQLPDGRVLVEIRDQGIGMDATRLALANDHFVSGEALAPDASEHMGLYVVGLLARRHAVDVELRAASPGTSAVVVLPQELAVALPARQPADDQAAEEVPTEETEFAALEDQPAAPGAGEASSRPPQRPGPTGPGRPRSPRNPDFGRAADWSATAFPPLTAAPEAPAFDGATEEDHQPVGGHPSAPAAESADAGGRADAGLPRRVPGALLKPGSATAPAPAVGAAPQSAAPAPAYAPEAGTTEVPEASARLRSRLGALHQGIVRADDEDGGLPQTQQVQQVQQEEQR